MTDYVVGFVVGVVLSVVTRRMADYAARAAAPTPAVVYGVPFGTQVRDADGVTWIMSPFPGGAGIAGAWEELRDSGRRVTSPAHAAALTALAC